MSKKSWLGSWSLGRARTRAEALAGDPKKTRRILDAATRKADRRRGPLKGALEDLQALIRMVRAWISGTYREAPWQSIALALAAIVYFVMPLDAIPDAIPVLGLVDDVTLIVWTVKSIRSDVDAFRAWEGQESGNPT